MFNFGARANSTVPEKRSSSFSGTWYEGVGTKLKSQLDEMLNRAHGRLDKQAVEPAFEPNPLPQANVLGIIVPHAGYMFSGATAAYAYKYASQRQIKRVFLLGPSHYVNFEGAVLPSESIFATPVGDLPVDRELVKELSDFPVFRLSSEVHRHEHSLELQLPFIREAFGEVEIVPIIIGTLSEPADIKLLGRILRRYITDSDLVVVSSDFTHFGPRYQYEPFHDNIRENVRKLDGEAFHHLSAIDLDGFLDFRERTNDTICGFMPCSVLLSMLPEDAAGSLLNYRTSQDTIVEDDRNSVSYLAIVFSRKDGNGWEPYKQETSQALSSVDRENLLAIARASLESYVKEKRSLSSKEFAKYDSPALRKPLGAFITIYRKRKNITLNRASHNDLGLRPDSVCDSDEDGGKELRGCIGYIWPIKPLMQTVIDNTIGACAKDPRFKPVSTDELPELVLNINVLTEPHPVSSYKDIVVGTDGVILYKQGRQAVFLPSVATEFGWNLEELLTQLSLKAGLGQDGWRSGARFEVFQSQTVSEKSAN